MERHSFDRGWTMLAGDLASPVARNSFKAGTAGMASDLTLDEGGDLPIPPELLAKLGPEMRSMVDAAFRTLAGEWRSVQLPDDWTTRTPHLIPATAGVRMEKVAADEGARKGYLPTGVAWYRKVFDVPAEWEGSRLRLEFDGVMRDAHVWLNGSFLGSHYSGYTGFGLDVSDCLRYGDEGSNVVLVRTDTTSQEGWWAEGGGIYRHTWLVVGTPVHVARHGIAVTTVELSAGRAVLRVLTEVTNESTIGGNVQVEHRVHTPSGEEVAVVAGEMAVAPLSDAAVSCELVLQDPAVWSLEDPALHTLVTDIRHGGVVVDTETTTFGVRTVDFDSDGLLLNGRRVPIHGACVHQDFAGVGIALPDAVHEYKIRRLKEMGCNAYRSAHHPASPELLAACDRLGMLVLDENRRLEANEEGLADLAEMVRRGRNHPSIFMWSLENEELIEGRPLARRLLRRMVDVVRLIDPSRPCTIAAMAGKSDHDFLSIPDVAGFNYDRGDAARYRVARPGAPVMATEDSSYLSNRGVYADDPDAGLTSAYDEGGVMERLAKRGGVESDLGGLGGAAGTEGTWLGSTEENRMAMPALGGVFVWTGFDYRGECAPWGWPAVNSAYGSMDLAGFPKDVFHYWRSRFHESPVVHTFPHWNWPGLEGRDVRVVVYSNCERVELVLNGEVVGVVEVPPVGIAATMVPYRPGALEAHGVRDGVRVVTSRRVTAGPSVGLRLSSDHSQCTAGGDDVVVVRVDVVDADGNVVPNARPRMRVECAGGATVVGTGSGAPNDHIPAFECERPAFNGHWLAVVRTPASAGEFVVTVTADQLPPASLRFTAR